MAKECTIVSREDHETLDWKVTIPDEPFMPGSPYLYEIQNFFDFEPKQLADFFKQHTIERVIFMTEYEQCCGD